MSKRGSFRTTLEFLFARTIISGLGLLPRRAALALGVTLGRISYYFPSGLKRAGEVNLKLAFAEKTEAERGRLLLGCFQNLGRLLGEFSQLSRATPEGLRQLIDYDPVGLA
ncbi:MAG TPA: lipid A biosynthesis acyltransferase, partial [Candidatus Binatia bacterium]|nr:lipid A biosynthesis acyltransferase [Candidatus Binatia bacterium]